MPRYDMKCAGCGRETEISVSADRFTATGGVFRCGGCGENELRQDWGRVRVTPGRGLIHNETYAAKSRTRTRRRASA